MNHIVADYYPLFRLYQALRDQLMEILTDADLAFQVSGGNPTLGALCREMGEVEQSYIESFKTFTLGDSSYRDTTPGLEASVAALTAWFAELDHALKATVEGLSDDDIANRTIDRGGGFQLSPQLQLDAYKEALLIFYGKVSVYLKALGTPIPQQWQGWIG
jgi:uncharacterized damage-inducible protein DinB